ncbi:hypothetical protein [Tritonibacter mobilis]|uniref:hypothetical protein n=1 Tax=Tritonibacter mobilis TaxID=379347 RepID=UPI000B56E582|nr:hypothetical protein [Tritonibacter mobilis]ANH49096.1 hypothetical protein [Ruegeria phage 45A6]
MADKDQDDDNIFDEGEMEDDGTADIIRKAYEESMKDDEDDDGGFDQPLDAKAGDEPDVVSPEKGRDLLDDAEMAKAKGKTAGDEDAPDDEKPKGDAKPKGEDDNSASDDPEGDKDGDDKPADLKGADLNSLLDGVPDDRKGEISRRLGDAERVLAPFKAHEAELKRHGQTPEGAINRLLELNTFAQSKPDEYLAWVATQTNSEPHKALEGAAKLLGYKLTKDGEGDDDDMFSDPETKALKEENDRLKAQLAGKQPGFGPDTPERQQARTVQQQLQSFVSEVDEVGQLKRPFFEQLRPRISEMATAHRNSTGNAVTTDDLQRFYDQAVAEARTAFGAPSAPAPQPGQGSAAQGGKPVADQIKEKAAAAQRAQKASKSVDGTGQGASRRPALSDDASLDDVIRHFASQD